MIVRLFPAHAAETCDRFVGLADWTDVVPGLPERCSPSTVIPSSDDEVYALVATLPAGTDLRMPLARRLEREVTVPTIGPGARLFFLLAPP